MSKIQMAAKVYKEEGAFHLVRTACRYVTSAKIIHDALYTLGFEIKRLPPISYQCPVCNEDLRSFNSVPIWLLKQLDGYGYVHSIFAEETFNLLAYDCPLCGAPDRDRLYALYLKREFSRMDITKKYAFVDFGPSAALSKAIREYPFLNYRSADLFLAGVDDRVDIADMPIYRDNSIDMFLCSHVLEHVEDDNKAIAELYRILKPGGWGIVMAPILLTLSDVYEDASKKSETDRGKHFGSYLHFRIYSKHGFVRRLEQAGFKVSQFGIDYFGAAVFEKHGIHRRSVLYVVKKPLCQSSGRMGHIQDIA